MGKPLIMVTNDDGIDSPGLWAAAEAAAPYGDLLVVAPHMQQTGMGRAFPRGGDTGIIEEKAVSLESKRNCSIEERAVSLERIKNCSIEEKAYAVHGSPALAVAHGVMELAGRKPDLCISGINYGENLGTTITCSGTLGALFEANSYGIPGIAVSVAVEFEKQRLAEFEAMDWAPAQAVLQEFLEQALEHGMPDGVDIWNINVPAKAAYPCPCRVTVQSRQNYFYFTKPPKRDFTQPFQLKSGQYVMLDSLEQDSDIYAVYVDHVISATPLCMDMSVRLPRMEL